MCVILNNIKLQKILKDAFKMITYTNSKSWVEIIKTGIINYTRLASIGTSADTRHCRI